jgi:translocator protein
MPDLALLVFFALVIAAALSGVFFKPGPWYERLKKPSWTPPNIAFPIVWSVLYVMIAIAGWLVWREEGGNVALIFWGVQLALNAGWSYLFFGARRMDLAMTDVLLLWIAVAAFIVSAWPAAPAASILFLPYLVWVSIAANLNRAMRRLNPEFG